MTPATDQDSVEPARGAPAAEDPRAGAGALIGRLRDYLASRADRAITHTLPPIEPARFAAETGFTPRRQGKPEVVLGADVAVELGHPQTASQSMVLTTSRDDLIHDGRLTVIGPDLPRASPGQKWPYAQVVLLALTPDATPDPFELEGAGFLIHRLPGYMVRSIPGRLWVRISRKGVARGLTLTTVARALMAAYHDFSEVAAIEVVLVTGAQADVAALAPIALEAQVLAGRHKKLALSPGGDLECNEMSCETCDEKPVCDDLREVVKQRRRRP